MARSNEGVRSTAIENMKISVYVTSYNQKEYLVEAVESVLNQTLSPSEIILADGCSTDGSQEVIADYRSRYPDLIPPIYHTENQGIGQLRVDALSAVTGDYVSHVDGDDRFLPSKLEKEARLLRENPDAKIAFSNHYYVTADGRRTGMWVDRTAPPQGDVFSSVFSRDFPRNSLFRNELVDHQSWKRVGTYDPNMRLYEDDEMLIRLTKQLRVAYQDEPLAEYRRHTGGLSSARAGEHLAALEYAYRKNQPLLNELSQSESRNVRQKLDLFMARIARQAAREAIEDFQRSRELALRYFLKCLKHKLRYSLDYKLIVGILMPRVWNMNRKWREMKG